MNRLVPPLLFAFVICIIAACVKPNMKGNDISGEYAASFTPGRSETLDAFGKAIAENTTLSLRKDKTAAMYSGRLRYYGKWHLQDGRLTIVWEFEFSGSKGTSIKREERFVLMGEATLQSVARPGTNSIRFERMWR
jgi:hypothetical protein